MSPESRTLTTLYPGFYATLKGEVAAKSASRAVQVNFRPGNLQTSRNFFPSLMRPFVRAKSQFVFKRSPSPSCFHDSGVYFRQSIGKESLSRSSLAGEDVLVHPNLENADSCLGQIRLRSYFIGSISSGDSMKTA